MDEEDTQVTTKYDEYLQEMPEEVQDFMWSDLYDIIIVSIQQTLSLTNQQTTLVKNAGYDLLMEVKTMNEAAKEFKDAGMTSELITKSLYLLDTEILTRAENITEYFTENPEDAETTSTDTQKPIPTTDVFARLSQSLVKPTPLTPAKGAASTNLVSNPIQDTPIIDPYRELPDTT